MTEKEKIFAAAEKAFSHRWEGLPKGSQGPLSHYDSFAMGVQWRDKNPSPEVEKLINALEIIASGDPQKLLKGPKPFGLSFMDFAWATVKTFKESLKG